MNNKLETFKKKLIYRASYRGTKEMDMLLSKFVNKYIDIWNESYLNELEEFLNYEDEVILNYYRDNITRSGIEKNKISEIFKNFKI